MRSFLRRPEVVLQSAVALAAIIFYLVWEFAHRGVYAYASSIYPISDADEWRYTACSRLVAHGYSLFDQVFSAQPPVFFLSLAGGMQTVADSIDGARSVEIAFGLLLLLSAGWFAAMVWDRTAAAGAMLLLAVSPGFLVYSHTVEAEGPMAALSCLSLALAALYRRQRHPAICLLAGLVLSAATLMKLFAVEAVVPAVLLLVPSVREWRTALKPAALYLAGAIVPVVLDLALVSPSAQWTQVVSMHNSAASVHFPGLDPAPQVLGQFLALDLGLSVLAAAGLLVMAVSRRWQELAVVGSWLLGTCAMLLLFRPLFPHHPAILVAPLAIAAGIAVSQALDAIRRRNIAPAAVVAAASLAYLVALPRLAHADRHTLYEPGPPAQGRLAAYVDGHTRPGDLIAVDDLEIASLADRLVVPPLCDPSNVRLLSGYLSRGDLVHATTQYRPRVVLLSTGLFKQVPGYVLWLDRHYSRVDLGSGATAYVRR